MLGPLLLIAGLVSPALPARGAPDPVGALRALVGVPLALLGDGLAGSGLLVGSTLGLTADALSYLDENPATAPVLGGRLHGGLHALAHGMSQLGTGSFERLRGVDVERWPEPAAAYHAALPGAGRLDTAVSGGLALALAPFDATLGSALAACRAIGAGGLAERAERALRERRIRLVGPSPAPPGAGDPEPLR